MHELVIHLSRHSFSELFRDVLGWDLALGNLEVTVDGRNFRFNRVAQKRGFQLLHCETDRLTIINRGLLWQVQKRVSALAHEHVVIYSSDHPRRQVWQWAVRLENGRRLRHREHPFFSDAPPAKLLERLGKMRFTLDEEEDVTLLDALDRVRRALDTTAELNLFAKRPKFAARSDDLAAAMQNGDMETLHRFILFHQPLVRWVAGRLHKRFGIEQEDAEQIGMLGLLHAAERYDRHRGLQFSTYATYCIEGFCKRYAPPTHQLIRIPIHIFWPCVEARRDMLRAVSGESISPQTYLRRLQEDDPTRANLLVEFERATTWKSLSDRTRPEYREARALPAPVPDPLEEAIRSDRTELIETALGRLHHRHAQILRLRYGIGDAPRTLEEVGQVLGVTRERVRQLQNVAEGRLRDVIAFEMPSLAETIDEPNPGLTDAEAAEEAPEEAERQKLA